MAGETATQADVAAIREQLGLTEPMPQQYARYLASLAIGDFGTSILYRQPAFPIIATRLPATLELTLLATILTAAVGIPMGVLMAVRQRSWVDGVGAFVDAVRRIDAELLAGHRADHAGLSRAGVGAHIRSRARAPGRRPAGVFTGQPERLGQSLRYLMLPTITLAAFQLAFVTRLTRSSVVDELGQTYVRAARREASLARW